jgi:ABC-type branched-subunit amino acid transport system substrate-binding protein
VRRGALKRGRAITGCAVAALAVALAGCTTTGSTASVTVSGKALTIYASVPTLMTNPAQAQDVFDAEQLALHQLGGEVTGFTVKLVELGGSAPQPKQVPDNARTAIQDTTAIAYIGEVDPGASAGSIPITEDQDLLQVSPTDTALEYTQSTAAVPSAPAQYYAEANSTYGHTFARVVPNSSQEAVAQAHEMQSLGVRSLFVTNDGGEYGAAIALAVSQQATKLGIRVSSGAPTAGAVTASGADALFIGASGPSSPSFAARLVNDVASSAPTIKEMFGSSSLDNAAFAAAVSTAAQPDVYVSAPGFLPADLTPAGQTFVSDFKTAYGHEPALGAIFGYEAMAAVLSVLHEAGSAANNRTVVVHDFLNIKDRSSVLGTYSIEGGDTTLGPFVFSRFESGKLVPFRYVPTQG